MDILGLFEVKEEILDYNEQDPSLEDIATLKEYSPTIYTTRLDDMHLFKKDLSSLPSRSILNYVIAESKPKVTKRTVRIIKKVNKLSSFNKLICQVEEYNDKVSRTFSDSCGVNEKSLLVKLEPQDEATYSESNGNQKLLGLCRPLSVTLSNCESILKYYYCSMHERNSSNEIEIMRCRNCVKWYKIKDKVKCRRKQIPSLHSSREHIINNATAKELFFTRLKQINKQLNIASVVMKNIYLDSTEICYISHDLVTLSGYQYVNHIITTDEELSIYVKMREIIEFFNCCWHKRRDNINKLLPELDTQFFLTNIISHLCPHFNCKCCCKVVHQMVSSKVTKKILKAESERKNVILNIRNRTKSVWQQLMSESNNETCLINKALNYSDERKLKAAATEAKPQYSSCLLHLKSNPALYGPLHCVVSVGEDGLVQNYIVIHRRHKRHPLAKYISELEVISTKIFQPNVCCWLSHQEILMQLPEAAAQFLKKPHDCPIEKCRCCCKKNIYAPKEPVRQVKRTFSHTKNYTTRLRDILKNVNILLTSTVKECHLYLQHPKAENQIHNIDSSDCRPGDPVVNAAQTVPTLNAPLLLPIYTFMLPPSVPPINFSNHQIRYPVTQQTPTPISTTNVVLNPNPMFSSNAVILTQPYNGISKVNVSNELNNTTQVTFNLNNSPTNLLLLPNQECTQPLQLYSNGSVTNIPTMIPCIQPVNAITMPAFQNVYSFKNYSTSGVLNNATQSNVTLPKLKPKPAKRTHQGISTLDNNVIDKKSRMAAPSTSVPSK